MTEVAYQTGAFLRKCSVKQLVRRYYVSMNRFLRTSLGFQSPASIMIVVPTIHLGEERQCDPDLNLLFNVRNTTVTMVERPGTR